jgi:hypothetical protein
VLREAALALRGRVEAWILHHGAGHD